jgi:hypothetical protein
MNPAALIHPAGHAGQTRRSDPIAPKARIARARISFAETPEFSSAKR